MAASVKTAKTRKPRDPREVLEVPLRRPYHVGIPFVVCLLAAAAAIFLLPKRYQSSTLILVESEKMPDSFVQKMATETTRERLGTVKQEILSRTRLETVIQETNPYPDLMGHRPLTEIVENMRRAISVNFRGSDAFSIDFVHEDPQIAMKVANRLTTLFIEQTTREREEQVEGAYRFIETQLEQARGELQQQEEALRLYKEKHIGSLPEQTAANLATLQRLQLEEQAAGEGLRQAEERRRLIAEQARAGEGAGEPSVELAQLRAQLAALRLRYTDEHPDVKLVLARIERIEQAVATPPAASGAPASSAQGQLAQAQMEVSTLKAKQQDIEARIGAFQARVELAPRTEQDLATLTRDYQKLKDNYLALFNKKLEAQMASKLEERWKGEHFKMLDPAHLPDRPVFPKPLLFLTAGLMAGLAAGAACAFAAEAMDHSIKSLDELESLASYPVLATIPYIEAPTSSAAAHVGGGAR